jgi:FkbM family methyltransferase
MKNIILKIIRIVRNQIPFLEEKQHKRVAKWLTHNGDNTLRLDYDLNKQSVVFDLGGYHGQWSSDIYSKYLCTIFIFEPYVPYFDLIKTRFEKNSDINVFDFGLASKNQEIEIYFDQDSTSIIKKTSKGSRIKLNSFLSFVQDRNIGFIDLIKINIEGAEFDLLEHICDSGFQSNIKNLQIQFHDFFPDSDSKVKLIRERLSETHKPTFIFDFVWENWELK